MKKLLALLLSALMVVGMMTACSKTEEKTTEPETEASQPVEEETVTTASGTITVVSREEGSGTRGAFVELMGVETDEGDMTSCCSHRPTPASPTCGKPSPVCSAGAAVWRWIPTASSWARGLNTSITF